MLACVIILISNASMGTTTFILGFRKPSVDARRQAGQGNSPRSISPNPAGAPSVDRPAISRRLPGRIP